MAVNVPGPTPARGVQYTCRRSGCRAVGGLSSTGGTAIDYAIQAPGVFRAVGSYSGFPAPSDPDAAQQIQLTLMGGGQSAEVATAHAQRYIPSSNSWVNTGSVPVPLSSSAVG